jgi:hypothetical protein
VCLGVLGVAGIHTCVRRLFEAGLVLGDMRELLVNRCRIKGRFFGLALV